MTSLSAAYPQLVIVNRDSPEKGGVWLHPDLVAIHLAQWCNPLLTIQVSRWVREWSATVE